MQTGQGYQRRHYNKPEPLNTYLAEIEEFSNAVLGKRNPRTMLYLACGTRLSYQPVMNPPVGKSDKNNII